MNGIGSIPKSSRKRPFVAYLALAWLTLLLCCAIFVPLLPLPDPTAPVGSPSLPPFSPDGPLLGTDSVGRSVAARLIHGARISLAIGVGATTLACVAGASLGLWAAYRRGRAERGVALLTDTLMAFPPLLVLLALAVVTTPGTATLVIALGILFIPPFSRIGKAAALAEMGKEYILAARVLGATHFRVMTRDLLPNCMPALASYSVVVMANVIVIEGSLSFLGVGIPPPAPSWGSMIAAGEDNLTETPFLIALPCLAIFATVFALNSLGDRVRTRLSAER
ncbi:ABC transporter permease [Nocardia sp. NPDC050799]|uniref:ABC transporter permease n=1 Tax=Nocardia sp. NPDC050799 TaxID=3154842 RepID=UPI0033E0BDFA